MGTISTLRAFSKRYAALALPLPALLLPGIASAQILPTVAGIFNIFVGLMLVVAFLVYAIGMILWFTRLGAWHSYRDEAIEYLKWAVAIMFVLVMLLAIVHFIQAKPVLASFAAGLIVLAIAVRIGIFLAAAGEGEDEGH
jgi:hypothetical protein